MSEIDFSAPQNVDDAEITFGGSINKLLPEYRSLPKEFRDGNAWSNEIDEWFFRGIPEGYTMAAKDGIDLRKALRHLQALMRSWLPKHEHKVAGAAYLLSLWFTQFGKAKHV